MEVDIEDSMGISPVHFLAGAVAGTAEHCGMYPVDTIKTHIQAQQIGNRGIMETTRDVVSRGGFRGLFTGLSAVVVGAAPAHALYFAVWEAMKRQFIGPGRSGDELNSIQSGAAGICGTIVADAVLTPMDAVKQKRQLGLVKYKGTFDCARRVVATEGIRALYASYVTTLVMNVPYSFLYFATYDYCRYYLRSDPSEYNLRAHLLSGAIAGATAAGLTNPLDVAKTRLQTQSDVGVYYKGMFDALRHIKRTEGWSGFSRGVVPRMIFFSMAAGIQFGAYEYVKHIFHAERYEKKRDD